MGTPFLLIAAAMLVAADALLRVPWLPTAAAGLVAAYSVAEWPRLSLAARLMLVTAGGLAAVVMVADPAAGPAVLRRAAEGGGLLAAFLASQFPLRAAARGSPMIVRCSRFFLQQRPGRRYLLLSLGAYLMSLVLGLGALALLGAMVQRGNTLAAAGGHAALRDVRERRMVLALLRGSSIGTLASPFSVVFVLVVTAIPGAAWSSVLPLSAVLGMLLLAVGWGLDRVQEPAALRPLVPPFTPDRDLRPITGLIGIALASFGLGVAIEETSGAPLPVAMTFSLPLVGLLWLAVQRRRAGAVGAATLAARRAWRAAPELLGAFRSELAIMFAAAAIAVMVPPLIPGGAVAAVFAELAPYRPALPLVVMMAVLLPSYAGISPIATVAALAAALGAAPQLPLPAAVLAASLLAGMKLSTNGSPFAAPTMILGAIMGRSAGTIGLNWNGLYVVLASIAAAAFLAAAGALYR